MQRRLRSEPSTCTCKNNTCLDNVIGDLIITGDEIVDTSKINKWNELLYFTHFFIGSNIVINNRYYFANRCYYCV